MFPRMTSSTCSGWRLMLLRAALIVREESSVALNLDSLPWIGAMGVRLAATMTTDRCQ